ncbi:heavy metal-associated isoprenylated plant protein 32-like [Argentina anserina]|uniref:heavy metal-associated isoprenylated plant protein 32-like n=1 Tax=Argentina anserina TaxID=57926 RepID=UPI002176333E|nr:heavy metal-associated isoprenylated plant protein 32-like [Potentilla anserina]
MAVKDETKPKIPGHEITCVLKLDTNTKGWHKTISKVLRTIEGASYSIDTETGTVTVTGLIDPKALMARLAKSGKHAELVKVDSGILREARMKKELKQKQLQEQREHYQYYAQYGYPYGYSNGYYPQQYGYHNHSGAGYPYGTTTPDYYRSHHQPYPNYYQQQTVRPTTTPPVQRLGFPQPPPPMEIHPFYDPETKCTIM